MSWEAYWAGVALVGAGMVLLGVVLVTWPKD